MSRLVQEFEFLRDDGRVFTHGKWEGSDNKIIKQGGTTPKGTLGEDFLKRVFNLMGYEDVREGPSDTNERRGPWDIGVFSLLPTILRDIGIKFECKLATEDSGGSFQFNGLQEKPWDYAFCLGVSPEGIGYTVLSYANFIKYLTLKNGNPRKPMDSGEGYKYTVAKNNLNSTNLLITALKKIIDERLERVKK